MAGVRGGFVGFFAHGVDSGGFHQPVNPPTRAGIVRLQHVIQAVQTQRGVFFMQIYQFSRQRLIALCPLALTACQPGIVPASGDFQQAASFLHRDSRATGLDVPIFVLYGLESMPTDFLARQ